MKKAGGPILAVVGRTNVGKSTLFNALAGRRLAIVEDTPGVTRDRSYVQVNISGITMTLVDTGGLVGEEGSDFQSSVREQAELAIAEADIILGVLDGQAGLHPLDEEVVELLRRASKKVIWIVNKCEKPATVEAAVEFYGLGIEDYVCVSAAHNLGTHKIIDAVKEQLNLEELSSVEVAESVIRIGIVGKPNVGKSTLVNKLLGEERVIASTIAGTTRDSIDIQLKRDGQEFLIVDTAGLRKKARIKDGTVERFSNLRTLRALAQSDVAVLLIDASAGFPTEQDAKIAGLIHERGIPLLIVVNKWDAVEKDHKSAREYTLEVRDVFKFARYAPVIFVSALTGKRCPSILKKAKELYEISQTRISTAEVNKIFERAFATKPPPVYRGEPIKLFFSTQVGVAPPSFVLFLNHPKKLPISYIRYLKNTLRKQYPFEGSEIKLSMRKRTSKANRLEAVAEG